MEDLAQVREAGMELLCQVANDLCICVHVAVLLVGIVGLFADDSGGDEEQMDISIEKLIDDGGIELLKFLAVRAGAIRRLVPDVVYAYPDKDDIGILGHDILVHPNIKVIYLVAADPGADEVIPGAEVLLVESLLHLHDKTAGFSALFGYGVAKKDYFLGFRSESG